MLTTGDVTEEIVLTDVDADAVIDVDTFAKICNVDTVIGTVLSTVEAE